MDPPLWVIFARKMAKNRAIWPRKTPKIPPPLCVIFARKMLYNRAIYATKNTKDPPQWVI